MWVDDAGWREQQEQKQQHFLPRQKRPFDDIHLILMRNSLSPRALSFFSSRANVPTRLLIIERNYCRGIIVIFHNVKANLSFDKFPVGFEISMRN